MNLSLTLLIKKRRESLVLSLSNSKRSGYNLVNEGNMKAKENKIRKERNQKQSLKQKWADQNKNIRIKKMIIIIIVIVNVSFVMLFLCLTTVNVLLILRLISVWVIITLYCCYRSLCGMLYLWFMALVKGWRNLIWLMMLAIFAISQLVWPKGI